MLNLLACTALKSTVHLAQIEEPYFDATEAGAPELAPYEYTLATEYRLKAHEEWGYSDYGASEELAKKAMTYSEDAMKVAKYGAKDDAVEERFEIIENIDEDVEGLDDEPEAVAE